MPAFSDLWYLTHMDPVQALIFQIPNGAVLGVREQLPLNPSQRVDDIHQVWHPKPACKQTDGLKFRYIPWWLQS